MTAYECRVFYPLVSTSFELFQSWTRMMTYKIPSISSTSTSTSTISTTTHEDHKSSPIPIRVPSHASSLASYFATPYTQRSSHPNVEYRTDHYLILIPPSTWKSTSTYHPHYYGMKVRDAKGKNKAKLELKLLCDADVDIHGIEGWWKCVADKIIIDPKNYTSCILNAMITHVDQLITKMESHDIRQQRLVTYASLLRAIMSTSTPASCVHEVYIEKQRAIVKIPQGQVEQTDMKVSSPSSSTVSLYRSIATESETRSHVQSHLIHTIHDIVKQEFKQNDASTSTSTSTATSTSTSTSSSAPKPLVCGYPAFVCHWDEKYGNAQKVQTNDDEPNKARL